MSVNLLKTKAVHPTAAIFGEDMNGDPVIISIADTPHLMVAGQTGSGKSVYVNGILVSVIYHTLPMEIQISWIDPKKVEASAYEGLPYSFVDPVTDMDDAYGFMLYMTWLMDERYKVLEQLGLKKIDEYNAWVDENPEKAAELGYSKWPFHIIVIDEYADLMSVHPEVEKEVVRIGQKARACGFHLMLCTQRPSVDVITGVLKANIPARVGMLTSDGHNSRIIIDEDGCENLKKHGDSLIKLPGASSLIRCQGPFITNEEINAIFQQLRDLYGTNDPVDYKTIIVEQGLAQWAEDYDDDVPIKDRHVKMKRRSMFG